MNLSDLQCQALVKASDDALRGSRCRLTDVLSGETYERNGDEMFAQGLYVDLRPWHYHFLRFTDGH